MSRARVEPTDSSSPSNVRQSWIKFQSWTSFGSFSGANSGGEDGEISEQVKSYIKKLTSTIDASLALVNQERTSCFSVCVPMRIKNKKLKEAWLQVASLAVTNEIWKDAFKRAQPPLVKALKETLGKEVVYNERPSPKTVERATEKIVQGNGVDFSEELMKDTSKWDLGKKIDQFGISAGWLTLSDFIGVRVMFTALPGTNWTDDAKKFIDQFLERDQTAPGSLQCKYLPMNGKKFKAGREGLSIQVILWMPELGHMAEVQFIHPVVAQLFKVNSEYKHKGHPAPPAMKILGSIYPSLVKGETGMPLQNIEWVKLLLFAPEGTSAKSVCEKLAKEFKDAQSGQIFDWLKIDADPENKLSSARDIVRPAICSVLRMGHLPAGTWSVTLQQVVQLYYSLSFEATKNPLLLPDEANDTYDWQDTKLSQLDKTLLHRLAPWNTCT